MNRPDAAALWAQCITAEGRLPRTTRARTVTVVCSRDHVLAALLPTPAGDLWATKTRFTSDRQGWSACWLSDGARGVSLQAHCPCRSVVLQLDPTMIDKSRRVVHVRDLQPSGQAHEEPTTVRTTADVLADIFPDS